MKSDTLLDGLVTTTGDVYTPHVGYKFSASGEALPFAGNTLVCHVDQSSPTFTALVALQNELKRLPEAQAFAFLPPASFHMTVFEGMNDADRDASVWPQGLERTLSVAELTEQFERCLQGVALPRAFILRPTHLRAASSVRLSGWDAAEERRLRQTRDTLAQLLGYKQPGHDTYGFHITLAYPLRYLTVAQAERMLSAAGQAFFRFAQDIEKIELGPLEFCTFETMEAFSPRLILKENQMPSTTE